MNLFKTAAAIITLVALTALKPQEDANAVAKKVQGITTFVNSEPSKPYKVVLRFTSTMITMVSCPSINQRVNECVKDGIKQASKKGIDFDAVIITDGEQDLLIKYE